MTEPITFRSESFKKLQAGEVVEGTTNTEDNNSGTTGTIITVGGVATKQELEDIKTSLSQISNQLTSIIINIAALNDVSTAWQESSQKITNIETTLNNLPEIQASEDTARIERNEQKFEKLINYLDGWINCGNLNMNDLKTFIN